MHMSENNGSKTPLTDSNCWSENGYKNGEVVLADFARQLERRCAELERECERLRDMLSDAVLIPDDYGVYGSTFYTCPYCHNESGAGVLNQGIEHDDGCPLKPDAAIRDSQTGDEEGEQS